MPREIIEEQVATQPEIESSPDYAQLEKLRQEIYLKLQSTGISKSAKDFLVARIFENSVEDGVDVADLLCLGREERIQVVTRDEFVKKQPGFARRLFYRVEEYQSFVTEDDEADLTTMMIGLQGKVMNLGEQKHAARRLRSSLSAEEESLLDQIDSYYDEFRKMRQLKEVDPAFNVVSKGEKMAEQVLKKERRILTPHYYTDPIRKLLGGVDFPELYDDLIDQSTLEKLLHKRKLSLDDEEVKTAVERSRYKPLDTVYHLEHDTAEDELKKEITEAIISRGYKDDEFELVLDETTKTYKILVKKEKIAQQELSRKNIKKIDQFEGTESIDLKDPKNAAFKNAFDEEVGKSSGRGERIREIKKYYSKILTRVDIVDGQIYKKRYVPCYGFGYIIFPDGTQSPYIKPMESTEIGKMAGEIYYFYYDAKTRDRTIHFGDREYADMGPWYGTKFIKSKDGLYQIDSDKNYDINDWGKNPDKNILWIRLDGEVYRSFVCRHIEPSPTDIEGELVYIVRNQNLLEEHYLYKGEQSFGPYMDVCFDHNNTQQLIFAAVRKNGQAVVFYDGKEHELDVDKFPDDIKKVGDNIFIKWTTERGISRDKKLFITNEKGEQVSDTYDDEIRIKDFPGEFCYIGQNKDRKSHLVLNGKEIHEFEEEDWYYVGKYKGQFVAAVLDKKRGVHLTNFKGQEIKIPGAPNKKSYFRCEINEDYIVIGFLDKDDQYRVYRYTEDFTLTEKEKEKIELLNLLQSSGAEDIDDYFKGRYPEEESRGIIDTLKAAYSRSKSFVSRLNRMIHNDPEALRSDVPAKQPKNVDRSIDCLITSIFPDLTTNLKRSRKATVEADRHSYRDGGSWFGRTPYRSEFLDGDPRSGYTSEVIHLREPSSSFLSTGIYSRYSERNKHWEQTGFPLSDKHFGPTKEVTAELEVDNEYGGEITLPKGINARIIPDRIKGVKGSGKEVALKATFNSLGEATVKLPKGIQKVLYSQTVQELPVVPEDITHEEIGNFRSEYERMFGTEITEKIARLPDELRLFLTTIKDKNPVEQLVAIEQFVRDIGYYDFNNRDIQPLKKDKTIDELLIEMAERMKELKREAGTEREKMEHKKYAGVCTDFAKLTTALLRECGFVSGIASGFQPNMNSRTVTTEQAHAISFALWPAEQGNAKAITLDGTPSGMNANEEGFLSGVRQMSLSERLKLFNENKDKVVNDSEIGLAELEALIASLDEDSIKKLENGKLEHFLNVVLSQVRESNLAAVEGALNASRYGGINFTALMEGKDMEAEINFRKFLEQEIKRERSSPKIDGRFKGEQLLRTIEEFVRRYSKDEGVSNKKEALEIVERITSMSQKYLNPIESKSIAAIITYLRAKKMK